jgi:hypothetical protein
MGNKVVKALTIVAILTMIASLLLPVWSIESEITVGDIYTDSIDYFSYGMHQKTDAFGGIEENSVMIADLDSTIQGPLVWFLLMTIIAIFLSLMVLFNDLKWRSSKGGRVALGLAALIALLTPLLFMINWTNALNSESNGDLTFSGSQSGFGVQIDYGPGMGWYLQFVAFALLGIALLASLKMRTKNDT